MSSIKFLRILVVLFSITLFSCEDEPVDPRPVVENSTADCSDPIDVTAVRSDDTSKATILWTANGDQTSWQVQYGNAGFTIGTGIIVASNAPSKIFPGLSDNASYDFYVRSKCSANQFSDWVGPVNVPVVGGIATGEYWPRAAQNQWIFSIDNINQDPWKIVGTEVINSNAYYAFQSIDGQPLRKIRKSPIGDYFDRYEDYIVADFSKTGNETIILKDYLPMNSSWTNTYTETTTSFGLPPQDYNVEIVSTIQERDVSVSVPAGTFNDCIVVRRVKTTSGLNVPTTTSTTRYWFAKNKGPVKVETEENGLITTQSLTAYILY
jgi:hypothetical protein